MPGVSIISSCSAHADFEPAFEHTTLKNTSWRTPWPGQGSLRERFEMFSSQTAPSFCKRAEYCSESAGSKRENSLSSAPNSVSSAKNLVSLLGHTNDRLKGTH